MKKIICAALEWDVFADRGAVQWRGEFLAADAQTRADILQDIKREIDIQYAKALGETPAGLRVTNEKTRRFAPQMATSAPSRERMFAGA